MQKKRRKIVHINNDNVATESIAAGTSTTSTTIQLGHLSLLSYEPSYSSSVYSLMFANRVHVENLFRPHIGSYSLHRYSRRSRVLSSRLMQPSHLLCMHINGGRISAHATMVSDNDRHLGRCLAGVDRTINTFDSVATTI